MWPPNHRRGTCVLSEKEVCTGRWSRDAGEVSRAWQRVAGIQAPPEVAEQQKGFLTPMLAIPGVRTMLSRAMFISIFRDDFLHVVPKATRKSPGSKSHSSAVPMEEESHRAGSSRKKFRGRYVSMGLGDPPAPTLPQGQQRAL